MRDTLCALGLLLMLGCGGGTSASNDVAGGLDGVATDGTVAGITLSGRLVAGAQVAASASPIPQSLPASLPAGEQRSALASGDPLVGYQLYCVTFATPPTAASGTADATGQVTLDLDAAGVAFGCFVLDTDGKGVATLIFTSGAQRGQTLTLTADADLGSIQVDLDNHVAQTDVSTTGTLTGSDGLACPLGAWVLSVPRQDCTGTATVTLWFTKTADGQYRASFTIGPIELPTTRVCGYHSEVDLPMTESGGAFTFTFLNNPTCALIFDTVVATPNGDCTQIAAASSIAGCVGCTEGQCGCGGGTQTCTQSLTATRQ